MDDVVKRLLKRQGLTDQEVEVEMTMRRLARPAVDPNWSAMVGELLAKRVNKKDDER